MGALPPLTDEAKNVIDPPTQIVAVPEVIETLISGTTDGVTAIVIPALVAAVGLAQGAFEVIWQVITSPFAEVPVV